MGSVTVRMAELPQDMPEIARLCWSFRDALLALGEAALPAIERLYPKESYGAVIDSLPEKHARPRGAILLAELDGVAIGCGMIQALGERDAEIKRVFVEPRIQGKRAGETLSRALIEQARRDGYTRLLLDTTRVSAPARGLYEKLGFVARGPYTDMPDDLAALLVFYELRLS